MRVFSMCCCLFHGVSFLISRITEPLGLCKPYSSQSWRGFPKVPSIFDLRILTYSML